MKKKILIVVIVVAIVAGGVILFMPSKGEEAKSVFNTAEVTAQHVTQSVTATGTIEPVTLVDVGTQVSGILTTLYVDYNSVVKKGQIIAELDKSTLILDLNSKKNSVLVAQSKYDYENSNYKRVKALHEKELIADAEYDEALYNYETAFNNLEIAKNNLESSQTNLGYATITSPIDGVVISKDVEEGQTVASSFSTPTLFTIAADLRDMRVIADVDEADIGNVEEGQKVTFTVDAYPTLTFEGKVTQVRQEGIEESNVITYEVVISAANPDLKLKPGLTANVEIFTLDVECESVVPVAALSFSPPRPSDDAQGGEGKGPQGQGGPGAMQGPGEGQGQGGPKEGGMMRGERGGDVVWVYDGENMRPRRVKVGVSNGIITEVEGVEVGENVVTGIKAGATLKRPEGAGGNSTSPFAPKRPGAGRR